MLRLMHRRALSFSGNALVVQFLAHLSHVIGPGVLAHLNLAIDL